MAFLPRKCSLTGYSSKAQSHFMELIYSLVRSLDNVLFSHMLVYNMHERFLFTQGEISPSYLKFDAYFIAFLIDGTMAYQAQL